MRTIIAVTSILASGYAFADKYGIDESLAEGGSSWGALSALGFLALPALFWICGNIPIVWITVGISGLILTIGGLSSGGPALYLGLLSLAAAWYGYMREQADEKHSGYRNRTTVDFQEALPEQEQSTKEDGDADFLKTRVPSSDLDNSPANPSPKFKPMTSREGDERIGRTKAKLKKPDTEVKCECGKLNTVSPGWRRVMRCDACGRVKRVN